MSTLFMYSVAAKRFYRIIEHILKDVYPLDKRKPQIL
jgi:hypothetical protein